jgi:hypothetical protein
MYYEEDIINGVLCSRGTSNGKWIPFTLEALTTKYAYAVNQQHKAESKHKRVLERYMGLLKYVENAPRQTE